MFRSFQLIFPSDIPRAMPDVITPCSIMMSSRTCTSTASQRGSSWSMSVCLATCWEILPDWLLTGRKCTPSASHWGASGAQVRTWQPTGQFRLTSCWQGTHVLQLLSVGKLLERKWCSTAGRAISPGQLPTALMCFNYFPPRKRLEHILWHPPSSVPMAWAMLCCTLISPQTLYEKSGNGGGGGGGVYWYAKGLVCFMKVSHQKSTVRMHIFGHDARSFWGQGIKGKELISSQSC